MRTIIMTVGHIHSGKTTFAKELAKRLPRVACLERDPVAAMLNEHFHAVLEDDRQNWEFKGGEKLKDKIFDMIAAEAKADERLNLIFANCNTYKEGRDKQIKEYRAEMPGARIIMVHFDIDMAIIEQRVLTSEKPTNVLTVSKTWMESLEKQKKVFQAPSADEADHFFVIRNNENTEEIIEEIGKLLKAS